MNFSSVRYVIGQIYKLCAGLFLIPIVVALFYDETAAALVSFGLPAAGLLLIGAICTIKRPRVLRLRAAEGLVITFLSWLTLSFAGALPFVLSGEIPRLVDAFFESASGFTTTGSTILLDVEAMGHAFLFWRSFTHLIGGMGVLVFVLALMPATTGEKVHLMKAEVPGPVFGKLVSRIRKSASILYIIYLAMTAVTVLFLLFGGMGLFDALIHAFGAAGTGGFSSRNASVAAFDSSYLTNVLTVAMFLFGVNFNLYFLLLRGHWRDALKSEELRWYVGIFVGSGLLLMLNLAPRYTSIGALAEDAFFAASSVMTTTGYSTADFGVWPVFSRVILLLLMFIGASAGSTGGGFKVSRVIVVVKSAFLRVTTARQPRSVVAVRVDGRTISERTRLDVLRYLGLYVTTFIVLLLLVALDAPDFETAFSAVAATFNNIGPGLGAVGPSSGFAGFSEFSKLVLTISMIAGRLEILPLLVFCSRKTWRPTT